MKNAPKFQLNWRSGTHFIVLWPVCSLSRMFTKIGLGVFPRSDYNKIWQGYSGG